MVSYHNTVTLIWASKKVIESVPTKECAHAIEVKKKSDAQ